MTSSNAVAGKHVLLTGGGGFLGQNVRRALERQAPLSIYAPRSAAYDLRLQKASERLFAEHPVDVVVHLAAIVGGIAANQRNPGRFFYDNAIMGIELMEQARRAGVKKFVSIGTICSYPKNTPVPFRETELWNGYPEETNAPYGLAKKMLLVQGQAYRRQYAFNAIHLLPVNLYGPGDNFHPDTSHVIPALIRKAVTAREQGLDYMEVWGTGKASREFLFVRDAAEGIALATAYYDGAEPVNIGANQEITLTDLAKKICELCRFRGQLKWDASKPDGQPRRCVDTTRAKDRFGFETKTSLHDGLRETVAWYEENRDRIEDDIASATLVRSKN